MVKASFMWSFCWFNFQKCKKKRSLTLLDWGQVRLACAAAPKTTGDSKLCTSSRLSEPPKSLICSASWAMLGTAKLASDYGWGVTRSDSCFIWDAWAELGFSNWSGANLLQLEQNLAPPASQSLLSAEFRSPPWLALARPAPVLQMSGHQIFSFSQTCHPYSSGEAGGRRQIQLQSCYWTRALHVTWGWAWASPQLASRSSTRHAWRGI